MEGSSFFLCLLDNERYYLPSELPAAAGGDRRPLFPASAHTYRPSAHATAPMVRRVLGATSPIFL
jgi:hypothetical protein